MVLAILQESVEFSFAAANRRDYFSPRRDFFRRAQELKRWQNAILRFAKIGVSRTNTIIFTVVSVHTFAKIGVGYPNCVIYIRISS